MEESWYITKSVTNAPKFLINNFTDIFNIPEQTVNKLVEKCSFIYEEVFIKACTNLIQNKENDLEEDIKRIDLISKSNDRLRLKIISLFYELYACSNYNVKLKSLICTT